MSRARDIANLQSGGVINDASADLDFRIESGGNANMLFVDGGNDVVVIGQNAPDTTISGGKPAFQVIGSGFNSIAAITRRDSGVYGPGLILSKSKSTTPDNYSIVANGDALGGITFIGDDGTNLDTYGASIQAVVDGTPGENDMPTRLVFSTTADGAASPTERMRITSSGDIGIGDSSPESNNNYKALTVSSTSGNGGGQVYVQSSSVSSVFGADATTDAKSILQTVTNHPLVLGTNNTGRMRIDTSGQVMIGTTDEGYPDYADTLTVANNASTSDRAGITVRGGTAGQSAIYFSDATGTAAGTYQSSMWHDHSSGELNIFTQDFIKMSTGSTERMRINSGGHVGIGESDISGFGGTYKGIDIAYKGTGLAGRTDNPTLDIRSNLFYDGSNYKYGEGNTTAGQLSVGGAQLIFANAPSGTAGATATLTERFRINDSGQVGIGTASPTQILEVKTSSSPTIELNQADTYRGAIRLAGNDLELRNSSGVIDFFVGTNNDHESNSTRAMMIDNSGNVIFGASSTSAPSMSFQPDSGGGSFQSAKDSTNTRNAMVFINPNGTVGTIATNGSATAYNTSSDYRLKENVVTDWDATSRLKQLKPSRFNFKADKDTTVDGFLAHEVSSIVPEAVTGTKDEVDENGDAVMQGIDQSKLVPLLVKTIQELEARIAKLEGD